MQVSCFLIKLRLGSLERAREWARTLSDRKAEVVLTLEDEGVLVESAFLLSLSDGDYLIYYMRAADLQKAGEIAHRSTHPIDAYHKLFKSECWEQVTKLEKLLDADTLGVSGF
jgi:hypothetical protein